MEQQHSHGKYILSLALLVAVSVSVLIIFKSYLHFQEPAFVQEVKSQGLVEAVLQENVGLSFAFVAVTGLLDGVNPCSIHLMLLLVGYILLFVKDRKKATRIGFTFIITIFFTYFIFGAALSASIMSIISNPNFPLIKTWLTYFFAGLLTVSALINIKDSIFSKHTTLDLEGWQSSFITKHLTGIHHFSTVILAFISTLFLLPCSLPLYLGSIHIISSTFGLWSTIFYVFIYSLMFVIPLFLVVSVLLRAEQYLKVEDFEADKFRKLRFLESIVQLIIAGVLVFF